MDRPAPPRIFAPPQIFAQNRRRTGSARATAKQLAGGAAQFLAAEASEDVIERLAFLKHQPERALVLGDWSGQLAAALGARGAEVIAHPVPPFPLESPWPEGGFNLIAALFVLDTANDLPGALIHLRRALAPGGLALAVLAGAGSLPMLRAAMLAADGDRPAARIHPQVDVRAGGQLLQRAGFAEPVADSHRLTVRYRSLQRLVDDLRDQALANALADPGPPLTKVALARAESAFAAQADADGKVSEVFELVTLSGRAL